MYSAAHTHTQIFLSEIPAHVCDGTESIPGKPLLSLVVQEQNFLFFFFFCLPSSFDIQVYKGIFPFVMKIADR